MCQRNAGCWGEYQCGVGRLRHGVVLLALTLVVLAVAAPAHAGTLDQQQSVTSSGFGAGNCGSIAIAQTFTAGITGQLDQLDVFVYRDERNTSEPLRVEIHSTVHGEPSGEILATQTLQPQRFGTGPFFVSDFEAVTFDAAANVVAGSQYAIVLRETGVECFVGYWWAEEPADTYGAGEIWVKIGDQPWQPATVARAEDFAFRTYVMRATPTSAHQCMRGGWTAFGMFKNQGDCMSWVQHNVPPVRSKGVTSTTR